MNIDQTDITKLPGGSPERFGYSWDRYSEILPAHEDQFLRWTTLSKSVWHGVRFLDVGCGIGRNAYWPMTYGAEGGLAIDVDERTLNRARINLSGFPTVEVRRQSIYDLNETNTFDIAFSIGVIHHLVDPEGAIQKLVQAARPGGLVLVWLYGRENNGWVVWIFNPLRTWLFCRLPLKLVHVLSWPLTALLWSILRTGLLRKAYYRQIRGFSFEHLRAIVFDHMIPRIARYYRRVEAEALLQKEGLDDVRSHWVNENSWAVLGRKPLQTEI